MSDWSQQAPMMGAQQQNGYMVMMVPMMVGNGQGGVPYQQDCGGGQPMMWAPQMGAMVPQGNSSMQGGAVALVPAAPGMWGQNGGGPSYGDDSNRKPGSGVGFPRQNQTFKKPGMNMGQQPRQHPQWFTPGGNGGSHELSPSAPEFTPSGMTELSASAAEFTPSSAGNIAAGKGNQDEMTADAKRKQDERHQKEREERRKAQAEMAAARRKRQEEEAAKKAAEEKKRAAEEVKPLDTAAFPSLGPLGVLGATTKAAPPTPKAAWGKEAKETREKQLKEQAEKEAEDADRRRERRQREKEAKDAEAETAVEAAKPAVAVAVAKLVEAPKAPEPVAVVESVEAPKPTEETKPSWASKAAEAEKKRQAEEAEKAKRQEAEQERLRKQKEIDEEKRRDAEAAAQKKAADDAAAKKLAEEKKKAAEEVKPIDASAFPTLGPTEVKSPPARAWGKDVAKEKREKEEAARAAEAAKIAEAARHAKAVEDKKAADAKSASEAATAAEAASKAARVAEEEASRNKQQEEEEQRKQAAADAEAEAVAATQRQEDEAAAKKASEEKRKVAEEVKPMDSTAFPTLGDKVVATAPRAWGKEASKKMKEDAESVKNASPANIVEARLAQSVASAPAPARVAGNAWGRAPAPKKETPKAKVEEAPRESGAWSDDDDKPELSIGAEATQSAEDAEEAASNKSETTTAEEGDKQQDEEDNATEEIEEADDNKKEKDDDEQTDIRPAEDRSEEQDVQQVDDRSQEAASADVKQDHDRDLAEDTATPASSSSSTLGSFFTASKKKKGKLAGRSSSVIMTLAEDEDEQKDSEDKAVAAAEQDEAPAVEKIEKIEKKEVAVKHMATQVEWPSDFDEARKFFLNFRDDAGKVPPKLQTFTTMDHEAGWKFDSASASGTPKSERGGSSSKNSDRNDRGGFFGQNRKSPSNKDRQDSRDKDSRNVSRASSSVSLAPPTPNAYKVVEKRELDRPADLKRQVQSLLNKIAPESVKLIAGKISSEAKIESEEELGLVIALVMKKALAEPHYCETYADLVYHLKSDTPEFPTPDGGKPVTFKSALLNVVQNEFEAMPVTLAPTEEAAASLHPEEIKAQMAEKKARLLANIRFIGNLYLRQLLTTKIIARITQELMICDGGADIFPEEHVVECICELLRSIGFTLESTPLGKNALVQVCGRMKDLKGQKSKDGKALFSKRIQFAIQDVLDARNAGWEMKVFKKTAKTKEEVRLEQERELKAKESGKEVSHAETVVAGQRPAYLDEQVAEAKAAAAAGDDWQTADKSKRGKR